MVSHTLTREYTLAPTYIPTVAAFSRDGALLILGCESGALIILNTENFSEVARFKHTRSRIVYASVSAKGKHAAAATTDGYVLLLARVPHKGATRWEYVGRVKAHHAPIVCVHFGEAPSGQTRCFSVSEDGRMTEYDLQVRTVLLR